MLRTFYAFVAFVLACISLALGAAAMVVPGRTGVPVIDYALVPSVGMIVVVAALFLVAALTKRFYNFVRGR
jgi:hypothetical protein